MKERFSAGLASTSHHHLLRAFGNVCVLAGRGWEEELEVKAFWIVPRGESHRTSGRKPVTKCLAMP